MPEIEYLAGARARVTKRVEERTKDPKDLGSFPTDTQVFFYNFTKKKSKDLVLLTGVSPTDKILS